MKTLLKIFCCFFITMSAPAESNSSPEALKAAEAAVANKVQHFKKTDDYELLIDAQKLSASMNPRSTADKLSKVDAGSLRLQLKVLRALSAARDAHYDQNAKSNGFSLNVMPPLMPDDGKGGFYFSGMDPKAISNLEARKAYEAALAENQRRNLKSIRERCLSRSEEDAVGDLGIFIRQLPADSPAQRSAFSIIEKVPDKTLRSRIQTASIPDRTR